MTSKPVSYVEEKTGPRRGFASIAIWQFMSFFMLVLMVWVNEVLDLPALMFGIPPSPVDFFGASMVTSFVILTAIVTVGNTFIQQRSIISGFLTICAGCHKIRVEQDAWQQVERYISRYCPVTFSHGLCPQCFEREAAQLKDLASSATAP